MSRLALLSLLPALALLCLGAACGGGGEEAERVPIRHLDFTGVELSYADYIDPPFAEQYPEVVAEVNGIPIGGKALAMAEVAAEMKRREAVALDSDLFRQQILAYVESTDPLEALIDEELKRQAVERLGLLPSYEEAVEFTRQQEESFIHPRGTVSPENREQTLEILRLQGLPTEDWASNETLVEGYRQGMGLASLLHGVCPTYAAPQTPTPGVVRSSGCTEFLRQEREKADIRYFVEWVD